MRILSFDDSIHCNGYLTERTDTVVDYTPISVKINTKLTNFIK